MAKANTQGMIVCQLSDKRIELDLCREFQKTCERHECFGCTSPRRLCANCFDGLVEFPEVDLCSDCLGKKLRLEMPLDPTKEQVACQRCSKKPVYYPLYKLCLQCTVDRFAPKPGESKDPGRPRLDNSNARRERRINQTVEDFYSQSVEFVRSHPNLATNKGLMAKLGFDQKTAKLMMDTMEKNGVVSGNRGPYPRFVLPETPPKPPPPPDPPVPPPGPEVLTPSPVATNGHAPPVQVGMLALLADRGLSDFLATANDQDRALLLLGLQMIKERIPHLEEQLKPM